MSEDQDAIAPTPARASAAAPLRVRTLLACDLVDSTALVERLGDAAAADLFRRHDRLARDLIQRHGGREIDKTDGYLVLFERPVEAVAFALAYQRALRDFDPVGPSPLRARVGIHVGEVVLWENTAADVAAGAKSVDIEGLAKPVVARLMSLAMPGQIVMSGVAFTIAQRAEKELDGAANLRWLTHGRYRFKGVPAPMLVHEVGEAGHAPLQAPPSNAKALRDVPLWRRPGMLALEGLALLAAIAIPLALSLRAPPAIAFGERDWVVIGDVRNLTGESVLDESLETAFRISLEQSRFVNVLPDLKLRDALQRMQRPPGTVIDRTIASEIALREGARAVILPTVAEVGGRVRFSAEVVDPHTETTVYAESADGVGTASTLDSIDDVTQTLRAKLGEALASIDQDSAPLPKVTSPSLDALRAYALGSKAYLASSYGDALAHFERAVSLDPNFALAHIGRARVAYSIGDGDTARAALAQAQAHRGHLTARDALYLDAWGTTFGRTEDKLRQWRLLGEMYPDFFTAFFNYAVFAALEAGRPQDALERITPAIATQNPARADAIYLRATSELALGRTQAALASFREALALAPQTGVTFHAFAHAAHGDFDAAHALLDGASPADAAPDRDIVEARIALAFDQGRFDQVDAIDAGRDAVFREAGDWSGAAGATLIGLMRDAIQAPAGARPALEAAIARFATPPADGETPGAAETRTLRLLIAAYLGARLDQPALARRALDRIQPEHLGLGLDRRQLRTIAEAEWQRARGEPAAGLAMIDALDLGEHEPFAMRMARLRLLRALRREQAALALAEALVDARGAAYLGLGAVGALGPLNIADTHLAALDAAELAHSLDRPDEAARHLDRFLRDWPDAADHPAWRDRIAALRPTPTATPH